MCLISIFLKFKLWTTTPPPRTIDPGSIVLGGGVVVHNVNFKKILIKHIRNYIFADEVKKIKILSSKLKSDTGLLGSAAIHK